MIILIILYYLNYCICIKKITHFQCLKNLLSNSLSTSAMISSTDLFQFFNFPNISFTFSIFFGAIITYLLDILGHYNSGLMYVFLGTKAKVWSKSIPSINYKFFVSHPASAAYKKQQQWDSNDLFNKINNLRILKSSVWKYRFNIWIILSNHV